MPTFRILRTAFLLTAIASTQAGAQPPAGEPPAPQLLDLKVPESNSREVLLDFLKRAKAVQPKSPEQFLAMQTAIRDGSRKLLTQLQAEKGSPLFQQVEFDAITSTVNLMATLGEDGKKKTLDHVHAFLKERKQLQLSDVHTGRMAAMMLEMQPNKTPARDTYRLLLDLLKDDKRPEMVAIRLQLEGSVRRLDMLGKPFEFDVKTMDGKQLKTADLKGQYVLVFFFTLNSESCDRVIPSLKNYWTKYGNQGLKILGVAIEDDTQKLQEHLKKRELPWPVTQDNASNPTQRLHYQYGVSELPLVLLLNKLGEVVSLEAHDAELDRLMQMLFEAPTPAAPRPETAAQPADAADKPEATQSK